MQAITFVNGTQTSIITTEEDLIKEINHYKAFFLSSCSFVYCNSLMEKRRIEIKVFDLDTDARHRIAMKMRG